MADPYAAYPYLQNAGLMTPAAGSTGSTRASCGGSGACHTGRPLGTDAPIFDAEARRRAKEYAQIMARIQVPTTEPPKVVVLDVAQAWAMWGTKQALGQATNVYDAKTLLAQMGITSPTTAYREFAIAGRKLLVVAADKLALSSLPMGSGLKGARDAAVTMNAASGVMDVASAAKSGAKAGGITIVFLFCFDVAEGIMNNDSFAEIAMQVGTDSVKVVLSTAAGILASVGTAALLGASTAAVAPAAAGLVVAVAVGYGLDAADNYFGVTTALRDWASGVQEDIETHGLIYGTIPGETREEQDENISKLLQQNLFTGLLMLYWNSGDSSEATPSSTQVSSPEDFLRCVRPDEYPADPTAPFVPVVRAM